MIKLIDNNIQSKLTIESFINKITKNDKVTFSTSGTTGTPKKITHLVDTLNKHIKDDNSKTVWGLTYEHTKIAGSQVILQAYKNNNTLVNLYNKSDKEISKLIIEHNVTHLSGTPTFYRLNFRDEIFNNVLQVTLGGEVVTKEIINHVKHIFPNAKVTNIYALTEYGSLLTSQTHTFKLTNRTSKFIKIKNDTLYVYFNQTWNNTGDVVELNKDNSFSIIGRKSSMINVGGQKVNPYIIENKLNTIKGVISSKIYGKKNSLIGNLVAADVVLEKNTELSQIKKQLREILKPYEIPRIIQIVENLEINKTGKISRTNE